MENHDHNHCTELGGAQLFLQILKQNKNIIIITRVNLIISINIFIVSFKMP